MEVEIVDNKLGINIIWTQPWWSWSLGWNWQHYRSSTSDHILCGDLNIIQNYSLDMYKYQNVNHPKAREGGLKGKSEIALVDAGLLIDTHGDNQPFLKARFDSFLVSHHYPISLKI